MFRSHHCESRQRLEALSLKSASASSPATDTPDRHPLHRSHLPQSIFATDRRSCSWPAHIQPVVPVSLMRSRERCFPTTARFGSSRRASNANGRLTMVPPPTPRADALEGKRPHEEALDLRSSPEPRHSMGIHQSCAYTVSRTLAGFPHLSYTRRKIVSIVSPFFRW